MLLCDSRLVARHFAFGQWLAAGLTLAYLILLVSRMRHDRKLLAVLFVPLSALGECAFALGLQLYHYRLGPIPVYVPLGHAVILSAGMLLAESDWVLARVVVLRKWLITFHVLVIGGALLLKGDTFSALLGAGFFLALLRSRQTNLVYLIIGVLVLYVELLGTFWGCWRWGEFWLGSLRTANPPPGAFVCYVIGEVLAIRTAGLVQAWWARAGARHLCPQQS